MPAGFLTAEQQAQIRSEAQREFSERKNFTAQEMKMNFNEYLESKNQAASNRQDEIRREQAQLRQIQKDLELEKQQKARIKAGMAQEASSTLNKLDQAKKDAWNRHHKDDTNKRKTMEILAEQDAAREEQRASLSAQKSGYNQDLQYQKSERQGMTQKERMESLKGDINHRGFDFECFSRDRVIAEEKKATTEFLKKQ